MAAVAVLSCQTWLPWSDAADDWKRDARDEELKRGRETRKPNSSLLHYISAIVDLAYYSQTQTQHTFQKRTCFGVSFTSFKESFTAGKKQLFQINQILFCCASGKSFGEKKLTRRERWIWGEREVSTEVGSKMDGFSGFLKKNGGAGKTEK